MCKNKLMTVLIVFSCIAVSAPCSEAPYEPFDATLYGPDYIVSTREIEHGEATVFIAQARRAIPSNIAPRYCRAWLTIERDGVSLFERYYADIDPVGS